MTDLTEDAKFLMNNPAFLNALDECKRVAMHAALTCDAKDDEGRRRYLDAVRTVDRVRNHLTALLNAVAPEEVDPDKYYEEQAAKRFAFFGLR